MMLFFDRDLGHKTPDALALLGLPVTKHDDHFPPMTKDEEWLPAVGEKAWVVVTSDERFWTNQNALDAIASHHVGCFILCGAGHRPRWYSVRVIARNWDSIEELIADEARPFLCRLRLHQPVDFKQFPTQ